MELPDGDQVGRSDLRTYRPRFTRRIADAGINIDLIYIATNTRIVLGVDKPDQARELL